jgi:hypothetical protein
LTITDGRCARGFLRCVDPEKILNLINEHQVTHLWRLTAECANVHHQGRIHHPWSYRKVPTGPRLLRGGR